MFNLLDSQTNELKPMKKLNVVKALFAFSLLSFVFVIDGCKKETAVKPITANAKPAVVTSDLPVDSANYLKGYLGTDLVKFEGNAIAYNGYIDPDSAQGHGGNGQDQDHDAYFMNGSKWVAISGNGLQSTNAQIELRSLAVRVFVSPLQSVSYTYYNLIKLTPYAVSTHDNPSTGAYVSLYDKNGVKWTSAGDQDGSTVTITYIGPNLSTYAMVSGIISCKMYDPQGNVKQLTGATFTASMGI
jgi:hypothetical protein